MLTILMRCDGSAGQLPLGIIPRDSRPSKIRENLYLGRAAHANDLVSLQELGITHIVNITDDCPNSFPDSFEYKHIAERDAPAVQLWPYFEVRVFVIWSLWSKPATMLSIECFCTYQAGSSC